MKRGSLFGCQSHPNTMGFVSHRVASSESTCFSRIGECKDGGWLARRYLSGKATTSRSVMASSSSSSGEASLQGREEKKV